MNNFKRIPNLLGSLRPTCGQCKTRPTRQLKQARVGPFHNWKGCFGPSTHPSTQSEARRACHPSESGHSRMVATTPTTVFQINEQHGVGCCILWYSVFFTYSSAVSACSFGTYSYPKVPTRHSTLGTKRLAKSGTVVTCPVSVQGQGLTNAVENQGSSYNNR